jgi:response regulator RpfG family c-di-GMP phosphodiesterase
MIKVDMSRPAIPSVLYVDDEESNLTAFKASFRKYYQIYTAVNVMEAKTILAETEINILITDQRMPGGEGTLLLEFAVTHYPKQARILISAYTDYMALLSAVQKGHITDFVEKPWDTDDLKKRIDYAYTVYTDNLEEERARIEAAKTNKSIDDDLKKLLGN